MTNEEVKKIALQFGFTERNQADGTFGLDLYVYAFANALIDSAEREEREACAQLYEYKANEVQHLWRNESHAIVCARAIRSRIKT